MTARTWRMFARRLDRPELLREALREFIDIGDERTVRFRGCLEPVEVELTEDPDGAYWGWLKTGAGTPVMIQPSGAMFRMQSPDGFLSDLRRGAGVIVRMSCRAVGEETA